MRRLNFLLGTVSGLAVVANGDHLFAQALAQSPLPGLPGAAGRCLVIVNLNGGNDGLNCVVPHGNPQYYQMRPSLAIPASDVLAIDAQLGFNSKMQSFKAMYDKGMVAVVQGVGYPNADHSHFRSSEIWQTGVPERYEHTGWLGRYLDDADLPERNLFKGVAVSQLLPEVLVANRTDIPTISNLAQYGLVADRDPMARRAFSQNSHDRSLPFSSPYLSHVMKIEDHAQRSSEELPRLISGYKTQAAYPATPIGRSLALAAQIVGSDLGTKIVYVSHGSFDTHVSQTATQNNLLAQFSDAMSAFYSDLAAHGNDRRVLTMTFSEFGRRVAENGSRGTDHGEASPLFLIGGGVKGGVYGTAPDLGNTNMGNVRYTTDFRSVYATVLERWLGRPSTAILGGSFTKIPVLS
ncbi:MAG: DUF1501 domain-containing protein [Candidatus Tumulicola sp.]